MTSPNDPGPDLQKIDVKVPLDGPADFDYDVLLAIFGRWRLDQGEEIIDLADYLHVPDGAGCLLVSQRWHFGVDFSGGVPGLFLSSRKGLEGDLASRFAAVLRTLLAKSERLLAEKEIAGRLRPRLSELRVTINDRVRAPNDDAQDARLRPPLVEVLDRVYGKGAYRIARESDPRRRLGWTIEASSAAAPAIAAVLERLG